MFKKLTFLIVFAFAFTANAQDTPTDYLSADFHKSRREALRAKMPANSVAVVFANPIRNRANDVDYVYHQDPNFYYLTGYREPNAVLLLFSSEKSINGTPMNEAIFVQKRDPNAEMWNGKRLGVEGAKKELGFKNAFNGEDFASSGVDFNSFDKVLFVNFKDDVRNLRGNADLYDLIKAFKENVQFENNKPLNNTKKQIYQLIKATDIENSANVAQIIGRIENYYPPIKQDKLFKKYKNPDKNFRKEAKEQIIIALDSQDNARLDGQSLDKMIGDLREIKTSEELKLLTKAIEISAVGQIEMMKAMHSNMSETEIQGIHEFVYKKYGAEYEGYPSIVGAGHNGCVLHYIENNKQKVGNDLVLMDLGAEYRGYTADVTRTIPANGKFSKEQKLIYDIVYDAQEAGIKATVVGAPFGAPDQAGRKIINKRLAELGIIASETERHSYFPHGTSHYLGLDVHDPGSYAPLQANSVITVEPGIYIPEGSPCDKKWWGIAVRIEDDILITENGPVNLSARAPRKAEEIEKMMKKKSVLDDFVLPNLD